MVYSGLFSWSKNVQTTFLNRVNNMAVNLLLNCTLLEVEGFVVVLAMVFKEGFKKFWVDDFLEACLA